MNQNILHVGLNVDDTQYPLRNAHKWNEALLSGKTKTLTELAQTENREPRYLSTSSNWPG